MQSWHAKLGLAAFIRAVVQPILGVCAFKGPGTNRCRRRAWYVAHVVCAVSLLGAGTFAVVTGVQKAKPHDVVSAEVYESMLYVWLAALCAAALLFELAHRCDGFVTRMSSSMVGTQSMVKARSPVSSSTSASTRRMESRLRGAR